jgi:hypothetical protein
MEVYSAVPSKERIGSEVYSGELPGTKDVHNFEPSLALSAVTFHDP